MNGCNITIRYPVLDIILRAIEALTVIDSCSQELCSSKKLVHLLATLIKLGDKIEVATSCVTAAVLIANLLSDSDDLILELNQGKISYIFIGENIVTNLPSQLKLAWNQ